MNTINNMVTKKLEIKKSIFISILIKVNNTNDVSIELDKIKKEYKNATHYCYAYIIDEVKRSSDDNEPSGTAGVQIMKSLLKYDLNCILCVVIRYFGGTKLGTGNLSRAYSKVVNDCINEAEIIKITNGFLLEINVNFNEQRKIDYLIKNYKYQKEFSENIKYIVECDIDLLNILDKNNITYTILKEKKIETKIKRVCK